MKKKIIIVLIILLLLSIISLIIAISKNNSKIIYCNSSEDARGAVAFIETILIYDNGVIKKEDVTANEKQKNKLSEEDLNKLKDLIKKVEDSELISKTEEIKLILGNGSFQDEEYINLNKKIILYSANQEGITKNTNENVEELNEFIEIIKEKYLKEE